MIRKATLILSVLEFRYVPVGAHIDFPRVRLVEENLERRNLEEGGDTYEAPGSCSFTTQDGIVAESNVGALLEPSQFEECLSKIEVDRENMMHHIDKLDATFKQNYAFYNVAKDPSASDPKNYQPELGNSIYEGENNGQVDLNVNLNELYENVEKNGASALTFYEIAEIFSKLRDSHVSLPRLPEGSISGQYYMFVIPERCLASGSTKLARTVFQYVDGELQMKIIWADQVFESVGGMSLTIDGKVSAGPAKLKTVGESVVAKIDGKSPLEYVVSIANAPLDGVGFKSLGSRVNSLFSKGWLQNPEVSSAFERYNFFVHVFMSSSKPSSILPDSFVVQYEDGKEELFFTGILQTSLGNILVKSAGQVVMNTAEAKELVNRPGRQFRNYERALGRLEGPPEPEVPGNDSWKPSILSTPIRLSNRHTERSYQFDELFDVKEEVSYGYVLQDDYAVFKILNFKMKRDEIVDAWRSMTVDAKSKGVTKVIVDISSNGGGTVVCGEALTAAMFPSMELKWFEDRYDVIYNEPMKLWLGEVVGIVDELQQRVEKLDDSELQGMLDRFSPETLQKAQTIVNTMELFCQENCEGGNVCNKPGEKKDKCEVLDQLSEYMEDFVEDSSVQNFLNTLHTLIKTIKSFNPWTVTDVLKLVNKGVVRTVNRGGVPTNLTEPISLMKSEVFDTMTKSMLEIDHSFDEYILLGNGAAGSTTQIFQATVTQLWRNRARTKGVTTKVKAVSYGGTNNLHDMSLAGFPATVDSVHHQDPIIAAGALYVAYTFVKTGTQFGNEIAEISDKYSDTLVSPPYFSETLARMAVGNFYDSFMNPGALPLEYVEIPPDEHIPQIYTGVTFLDSSDLGELYGEASKLFSSASSAESLPSAQTSSLEASAQGKAAATPDVQREKRPASVSSAACRHNALPYLFLAFSLLVAV